MAALSNGPCGRQAAASVLLSAMLSLRPSLAELKRWGLAAMGVGSAAALCTALAIVDLRRRRPERLRTLHFWWNMGPILLRYWWAKRRGKTEEDRESRYKRLHETYAPVVRRVVGELGGMFTKTAQFASVAGLLPQEYKHEFSKLQDSAPSAPWSEVHRTLTEDLNAAPELVFDSIQEQPLGAASLGQAHLASWRGRHVVVKVQYPNSRVNLQADFGSLRSFVRLTKPDEVHMVDKFKRQCEGEVDYIAEAANLRLLHDSIASSEFRDTVVLPAPIPDLTRDRVLGMDYLPGQKLDVVLQERLRALGFDGDLSIKAILSKLGLGGTSSDVASSVQEHPLPSEERPPSEPLWSRTKKTIFELVASVLGPDLLLTIARAASDARLSCKRRLSGSTAGVYAIDLHQIVHLLVDVHGFQVFQCAVFNADPHPGNVLALPDGRIGLIDFGQCAAFSFETKVEFARLILLLCEPGSPTVDHAIVKVMSALGVCTAKSDAAFLAFLPRLVFCKLTPSVIKDKAWAKTLARDRIIDQPVPLMMAFRLASLLRWSGLMVLENVSVAEVWRPRAARFLEEHGLSTDPMSLT